MKETVRTVMAEVTVRRKIPKKLRYGEERFVEIDVNLN